MLRRSHKKSRYGCLQCKRRHIKCDEGRPVCLLCTMSERKCHYPSLISPVVPSDPESASPNEGSDDPTTPTQATVTPTQIDALSVPALSALQSINTNKEGPRTLAEVVDLNQLELVIHLVLDDGMFNLSDAVGVYPSTVSLALKVALKAPYLAHQLLAFSARHLAFLHPERSLFYSHQAVTLQTSAVSLFNTIWPDCGVDQSNSVAVVLFSTVLGHHVLADTLARRDHGGLSGFITHYMQCVKVHRGIHTVATTAWPLLMQSELGPLLASSSAFNSRPPRGHHCHGLGKLVENAEGLNEWEKKACRLAMRYLQIGIDAAVEDHKDIPEDNASERTRYKMVFTWTIIVPAEFTELLAMKQPEALVLLGYYALLLHYGRDMWQVGDAGAYVLRLVLDYLGQEWHRWLDLPRETVFT